MFFNYITILYNNLCALVGHIKDFTLSICTVQVRRLSRLKFLTTWKSTTLLFWRVMLTVQSTSFVNIRKDDKAQRWNSTMNFHVWAEGRKDEYGMQLWIQNLLSNTQDAFWQHVTTSPKTEEQRPVEELQTQLPVTPGGLTSQLQLPYVAINRTFEALMCEKWIKWADELWVTTPGS